MRHPILKSILFIIVAALGMSGAGLQPAFANDNVLTNPSFEEGVNAHGWPVGWLGSVATTAGKEVRLHERDDAPNGKWVAALHHPGNVTRSVHVRSHPPVSAAPGDMFSASMTLKNTEGKRVILALVFVDANGKELLQKTRATSSTSWTTLNTGVHGAPANTASVRVMVWQSKEAAGSTTYFDDARLIKY